MRLPRMTTRQWLIQIAVVGLTIGVTIGGVRLKQRCDSCLSRAVIHHQREQWLRGEETRMQGYLRDAHNAVRTLEERWATEGGCLRTSREGG
jgi:hypothetical protein